MGIKRDNTQIIFDILDAIYRNPNIKITHILHKANLSHSKFKGYLEDLKNKQIIKEEINKKQKTFSLTQKGEKYYFKLKEMKNFMESFEI